jgi:4-hydroxyacetophenone monooxygenase
LSDKADFSFTGQGLRQALAQAHLPALMPAIACLTGDLSALDPAWQPDLADQAQRPQAQGGLSAQAQQLARERAELLLSRWQAQGCPSAPQLPMPVLQQVMGFVTGAVDPQVVDLLLHELGMAVPVGEGVGVPERLGLPADFQVVVIGAGMSGLVSSWHLQRLGIAHTVLERQAEIGGVWVENHYPGARLDTSNFCYSYSFAQDAGWRHFFSPRDEVQRYFQELAAKRGLLRHIQLSTEVQALRYDEAQCLWHIDIVQGGQRRSLRAHAVISAVGQLNKPRLPDIEGRERFAGPAWHTARWRHDVPLKGLRVGVIGTGASAFQVIPRIAGEVQSLTVFQRTPPWVIRTPAYNQELPAGLHWLLASLPGYNAWYRFEQFWVAVEGRRRYSVVDPDWQQAGSVSALNQQLRQMLEAELDQAYAGRPDLRRLMTPDYPPYGKRMLRDDGTWSDALKRSNVTVVSEPIARITENAVVCRDGSVHELDVIIYGTGFHASQFLNSLQVTGRGGVDLHAQWGVDAQAYQGVCVPNFPNLFMLYGPNTNLITNGSLVLFSEIEIEYILRCLASLGQHGARAMEVSAAASWRYDERIDAQTRRMAYGVDGVSNWYKSATGRVTQNWPFSTVDFWRQMQWVKTEDFSFWP